MGLLGFIGGYWGFGIFRVELYALNFGVLGWGLGLMGISGWRPCFLLGFTVQGLGFRGSVSSLLAEVKSGPICTVQT